MNSVQELLNQSSRASVKSDGSFSSYQSSGHSGAGKGKKSKPSASLKPSVKSEDNKTSPGLIPKNSAPAPVSDGIKINDGKGGAGVGKGKGDDVGKGKATTPVVAPKIEDTEKKGGKKGDKKGVSKDKNRKDKAEMKKGNKNVISPFEEFINREPEEELTVRILEPMDNVFRILNTTEEKKEMRFKFDEEIMLKEMDAGRETILGDVWVEDAFNSVTGTCLMHKFDNCASDALCGLKHDSEVEEIFRMKDMVLSQVETSFICLKCRIAGGTSLEECKRRLPFYRFGGAEDKKGEEYRTFVCFDCYRKAKNNDIDECQKEIEKVMERKIRRPRMFEVKCEVTFFNDILRQKRARIIRNLDFSPRNRRDVQNPNDAEVKLKTNNSKRLRNYDDVDSSEDKGSPEKKKLERPSRSEEKIEDKAKSSSLLSSSEELKKGREASSSSSGEGSEVNNILTNTKSATAEDDEEDNEDANDTSSRATLVDQAVGNGEEYADAEIIPPWERLKCITPFMKVNELMTNLGPMSREMTSFSKDRLKPVFQENSTACGTLTIGAIIGNELNLCLHFSSKKHGCAKQHLEGEDRCRYDHDNSPEAILKVFNLQRALGYECGRCNSTGQFGSGEFSEENMWDATHLKIYPGEMLGPNFDGWQLRCYVCGPPKHSWKGTEKGARVIQSPILKDVWRINASDNLKNKRLLWIPYEAKFKEHLEDYYVGKGSRKGGRR